LKGRGTRITVATTVKAFYDGKQELEWKCARSMGFNRLHVCWFIPSMVSQTNSRLSLLREDGGKISSKTTKNAVMVIMEKLHVSGQTEASN